MNIENILSQYINPKYILNTFLRGSRIYGTASDTADYDIGCIIDDNFVFIKKLENNINENDIIKVDLRFYQIHHIENNVEYDIEFVCKSDFINMINEHNPFALEAILLLDNNVNEYQKYFSLNKWKLRESFGEIASNSFVKAKKKLTVAKDYNRYIAIKSLYHSIRLLIFACEIAEFNKLTYTNTIDLYNNIISDKDKDWEYLKIKYKPIWNKWHTKLVELCPKPEEFFKKHDLF